MAKLALIKNGVVLNVIEVDADTVVITEEAGKGDTYDGKKFTRQEQSSDK